ncbi:MAG TPA: GAF domain-containing protein [Bryobacteraceae bacterium]|nr:GAF domain-containing protein [Bryobacteraceae bacterium]
MARSRLAPASGLFAALAVLLLAAPGAAQDRVSIEQAGARATHDFTPALEGRQVVVSGQISSNPIWIADGYFVAIQDETEYGLMLKASASQLSGLTPGDWVEADGLIAKRAGLPILIVQHIRRAGHAAPPAPKSVNASDLNSFRYMGVLVTVESIVTDEDRNGGGDLLLIGEKGEDLNIFLPRARRDTGPQLSGFRIGDRIRVTGIASQYCTLPPYDSYFQILISSPASVAVLERGWLIQPPVLLASLILATALAAIWWFRERRMAGLRKHMRLLNALGEQVVGATSPAEILRRLTLNLPALSEASDVGLYIQNRGSKILEGVLSKSTRPVFVDPEAPNGAIAAGVAACFRGRTLIAVHDTRHSPFWKDEATPTPRSVLFVPMFAQSELMGILEMHHTERFHYFSHSEEAAMQHLANQIATALKLQEQHSMREQLFRSEKLAATGQLISDVANELRSPLESIAGLASALRSQEREEPHAELESIAAEAKRASEIVGRLVSFTRVETSEVEPVDLHALLAGLLKFRAPEWKVKGVEIKSQLAGNRAIVMGSAGQLEQVLLNLLVDAEKSAAEAVEKTITVSTSLLANRVLVEITYPTRSSEGHRGEVADTDHGSGALGLGVCRGIAESHGGEFRVVHTSPTQSRFDIELPLAGGRRAAGSDMTEPARQLTVLVVEPDVKTQRQLVQLLGSRGDRVVPVSSAEEGADVVQRLKFDMAICAVRLPGVNWVEFSERVRDRVGGFVLLTDALSSESGRALSKDSFVLSKPVDEAELYRICRAVEEQTSLIAGD